MDFGKSNQNSFMENGKETYKQKCFQTFKYLFLLLLSYWKVVLFSMPFKFHWPLYQFSSVQLLSRVQLCDPLNRSTPGFPVHHQLLELTQTHVQWVSDAIQPSHPLSSPSPPPFIFPSIRVFSSESVLHIRWPKYWSFSFNISPSNEYSDWFPLGWTGWISLQSQGLSRVFSNTTMPKHQIFGTQLPL